MEWASSANAWPRKVFPDCRGTSGPSGAIVGAPEVRATVPPGTRHWYLHKSCFSRAAETEIRRLSFLQTNDLRRSLPSPQTLGHEHSQVPGSQGIVTCVDANEAPALARFRPASIPPAPVEKQGPASGT